MLARNRHEMTQRLDTAHRSLFAAYTAKSQFLSSLSHELRTPLNSVTGFADLVARGIGDPKSHAAEIQHAGEHMLSLINDILDFSRIEADQMPLAFQRVRLAKQMDEASRLVAVFARDRGVKIGMDIACPDSEVMGDARRLKQVILNLLTNAVKFTPAGGTVTMRLGDSADGGVLLEVSDCGCGIAPEDIPKVLTPFGQVVGSGGVWPEGTGLGLPISKALVEKHQGTLGVSSTPGVGTVVSVWLPQHRTEISA
jgi:signal transduction histidine kinase